MKVTKQMLDQISGHANYSTRKQALADFLNQTGIPCSRVGELPNFAQFMAQIMHESAGLKYTRELWGPTSAQRRYGGRKDLGNTQPGDGKRFMGRDLIQVTGRANYRALTQWVKARYSNSPDFEKDPDALLDPKWLGIGALWYWTERVPQGYIDDGNIEMVTRRVNGGLNGYADRLRYYDRAALVLLGYGPSDIREFQADAGLKVDGISGPMTRKKLHEKLVEDQEEVTIVDELPPVSAPSWLTRLLQLIFGGSK